MQRHIESCYSFNQWEATSEIGDRTDHRRCRLPAAHNGLTGVHCGAPHRDTDQSRRGAPQREGDLNWLAWRQIEAVKPGGRSTGEDRVPRKTQDGGREHNVGVIGYGVKRVIAATESTPTRTEQVILC